MSRIPVETELIFKRDKWLADLRAAEAELDASVKRMTGKGAKLPVTLDDQVTRSVQDISDKAKQRKIEIPVVAVEQVTKQVDAVRAQVQRNPIVVPVVTAPAGGSFNREAYAESIIAASRSGQINPREFAERMSPLGIRQAEREFNQNRVAYGRDLRQRAMQWSDEFARRDRIADQVPTPSQLMSDVPLDPNAEARRNFRATGEGTGPSSSGGSSMIANAANAFARRFAFAAVFEGIRIVDQQFQANSNLQRISDDLNSSDSNLGADARRVRSMSEEMQSGLAAGFRRYSPVYRLRHADADQELADIQRTTRETERQERLSAANEKAAQSLQSITGATITDTQGAAAGKRFGIYQFINQQAALARQASPESRNRLMSAAYRLAGIQSENINLSERHADNLATIGATRYAAAGDVAELRGQGREREASLAERRAAITERLGTLAESAQSESDPQQRRRKLTEFNAAYEAAIRERRAIDMEDARQRRDLETETQDFITDKRSTAAQASLRISGQYHAAEVAAQHDAINQQVRELQERYDRENDLLKKALLGRELVQARQSAAVGNAAVDVMAERRTRTANLQNVLGAGAAQLSITPLDFGLQSQLFEGEWENRIANADASERGTLIQRRNAERNSMRFRQRQTMATLREQTREATFDVAGASGLSALSALEFDVSNQLQSAGGNEDAQNQILSLGRMRAAKLLTSMARPQVFGSTGDYLSGLQGAEFGMGPGNAIGEIQDFIKRLTGLQNRGALPGEQDKSLGEAGEKLNEAADKLIKNNVMVLGLN
jgi:hypothetical protein